MSRRFGAGSAMRRTASAVVLRTKSCTGCGAWVWRKRRPTETPSRPTALSWRRVCEGESTTQPPPHGSDASRLISRRVSTMRPWGGEPHLLCGAGPGDRRRACRLQRDWKEPSHGAGRPAVDACGLTRLIRLERCRCPFVRTWKNKMKAHVPRRVSALVAKLPSPPAEPELPDKRKLRDPC